MNLNLYIAKKIKGNKEGSGKLSTLSNSIACASVAISIVVMFMAIAISDGFKKEIRDTSVGFSGEVLLVAPGQSITNDLYPISGTPSYLDKVKGLKGVKSVDGVAYKAGMLKTDESVQGLFFKGVDSTYSLEFYQKYLIEGRLPDFSGKRISNEILISERLADLMNYKCGDEIVAYFLGSNVRVRKFTITGLFSVQLEELDKTISIVDIRHTRRLNGWKEDDVSSIEILLEHNSDTRRVVTDIERVILENPAEDDSVVVSNIRHIYPNIFDWLDLLNLNVLIILVLMIVVAGFNMISGLLIILFEKTSMIGILKALGMRTKDICKVFIYRGGFIVVRGMVIGNVIAILLAILQGVFHIVKLDPSNYFVSHVPIYVDVIKIGLLNIISFGVMILIMTIPSLFIAKIEPDKTIKMD